MSGTTASLGFALVLGPGAALQISLPAPGEQRGGLNLSGQLGRLGHGSVA